MSRSKSPFGSLLLYLMIEWWKWFWKETQLLAPTVGSVKSALSADHIFVQHILVSWFSRLYILSMFTTFWDPVFSILNLSIIKLIKLQITEFVELWFRDSFVICLLTNLGDKWENFANVGLWRYWNVNICMSFDVNHCVSSRTCIVARGIDIMNLINKISTWSIKYWAFKSN